MDERDSYEFNKVLRKKALYQARVSLFRKMMEIASSVKSGEKMSDDIRNIIVEEWEEAGFLKEPQVVEVEVEREKKTPQHVLDRMKLYNEMKKLESKMEDKEGLLLLKKEKAMKRKKASCYRCLKVFDITQNEEEKEVVVEKKPRRNYDIIILKTKCPYCDELLKIYCGKWAS